MTERALRLGCGHWRSLALGFLLIPTVSLWGADAEIEEYVRKAEELCRKAQAEWHEAGSPGENSPAGEALVDAAIHADRPDLVDRVLAEGDPLRRMLPIPPGGRRVPLQIVHEFRGVYARFSDEMYASIGSENRPEGWLARRITKDAIEVWTPKHGWLFDGHGQLRHEARPPRRSGWGREWYGAFLPNGRWVTTDLDEMDGTLRFFSVFGKELRALQCEELAPRPADGGAKLLGWGRSDRDGNGWVVNVGSEEGWAAVWVGPTGPARVLKSGERWALCYRRALGPRGTWLGMSVPDDARRIELVREEASHGPGVGLPNYASESVERRLRVADGNAVFGFWPGRTSYFIGAERDDRPSFINTKNNEPREASGWRTRKLADYGPDNPTAIVDKTWFFDSSGKLLGWVRARRIGDAADGRSMLFRATADGRIMTMGPDLRVKAMRRFVWSNGNTADAIVLWDDLRLGVFIHHRRLILATW